LNLFGLNSIVEAAMKREIAAIITCLLVSSPSFSVTLHVPSQYPTIQAGINAAQTYDTVLVAAGTYYEHIDFLGQIIVVKSASGPGATTIDGDLSEGYVVTFSEGGSPETMLEGFTVTHGHGQYPPGGGIFCDTLSSATIKGNYIISNGEPWNWYGAGISAWHAAPHLEDNLIAGNVCVYYGAGIYLSQCFDVVIRYNVIANNYTTSGYGVAIGGGIYSLNTESIIERNVFEGNVADVGYGYGGAIAINGSGVCSIFHNTFSANLSGMSSYPTGSGICVGYQAYTGSINFDNNIMVNSPQGGGFSLYAGTPIIHMDFNDVWNNVPFNYYGCAPGLFDISADPQFAPYAYELTAASPCVDAGSFMANPDPDGTRADMGAFPFDQPGMNVAFQPYVWPINIPASGGWFAGHFFLTNHTSALANFDFWVDVLLPDSSVFGPIILRRNLTFSPNQQIMRAIVQNVPARAPAGNYLYRARTGIFQTGQIYCETAMPFTKLGMEGSDGRWTIQGDLEDWGRAPEMRADLRTTIRLEASPNPFNPGTTLSFSLPAAGQASVKVYDLCGRTVATLLDRQLAAGRQEITFESANLASGIYWAVLQAGGAKIVQKLMLMK